MIINKLNSKEGKDHIRVYLQLLTHITARDLGLRLLRRIAKEDTFGESHAVQGGLTSFLLPQEFRNRKDGDIVLPAEKGKVIMWYNYELDGHTG